MGIKSNTISRIGIFIWISIFSYLNSSKKQYFRVNSEFQSRENTPNSETIYKFTTFLGVKGTLSCFKQLPVNFTLIFELYIYANFRERL